MKMVTHSLRRKSAAGFTLIELLTVVVIIVLMLSGAAVLFKDNGRGVSVSYSVPTLAGTFAMARNQAMASGTNVRLVVDSVYDVTHPDNYLRRFALMQPVGSGTAATWEGKTTPTFLPKGVYYSPIYSVPTDRMTAKFDLTSPVGSQYYYEFDETGQLTASSSGSSSARMVVTTGFIQNGALVVPASAVNNRDGVLIHHLGRVSYFQKPDEITALTP